jgi:D-glycero-D-manno-heptose 1,7-bisphosphate phosphatase
MNRSPRSRPAVFLDRDGTLIEDRGYLADPEAVRFIPGAVDALRRLGRSYELFIVTNQGGVAAGITPLDGVRRVNEHVAEVLGRAGAAIRAVYCCPHRRSDGCPCIKPKPHFLREAEREHRIDLARSFVVGDHPHDVELAANAGARGIYVLTGHGANHRDELTVACIIVPGISEAADHILRFPREDRP